MVKKFEPKPYTGGNPLPAYVAGVKAITLVGVLGGGYNITLAKMTVGDSMSAGNPLTHVLFESYTDHGEQAAIVRTRVSGHDREFIAAMNAMIRARVEFYSLASCSCEELLKALGDWFMTKNPELLSVKVVSQTCH